MILSRSTARRKFYEIDHAFLKRNEDILGTLDRGEVKYKINKSI
ncbi:hypothetical protein NARC_30307 [Candidatus Nitrosocosmicus arcticus]|uniref:Uncharacterized protein n=1 Tax=Candidatus Nitrosocosmicus arcticus TaxID=2035267 RepID=A0A557SYC2_9ARCH|nr:hypothetical protein NARC_30307 [Candidatus Nitrosocosmicus arcticus]